MNKREAELQRCLEKTLKDKQELEKLMESFAHRTLDDDSLISKFYYINNRAINRITRTLRKGK